MNRAALACALVTLLGGVVPAASPAASDELTRCVAGQHVIDKEDRTGVIAADGDKLCQVKYADGQVYDWIFWNLRPVAAPAKPRVAVPDARPPEAAGSQALTVLKPSPSHTLVYRADRRGHFSVRAAINGAPISLVVDTGASLVALTPDDARAAGIGRDELVFNRITQTANGRTRFASVILREVRLDQLSVENVQAAVIENLDQSLLGMSFLRRLKSFEMRGGMLALGW